MNVAALLKPSLTRRSFCKGAGALAATAWAPGARAAGAPIRIVASNDYAPYSAVGADGKMRGLLVECLNLVAAKAGYAFEFHGAPWARAQQMVKTGEMDACCAYPTTERRAYLNFIDGPPVITDRTGVVHRAADKRIQPEMTKEQLGALRIGTFLGATWSQFLFPDNKLTMTGSQDAVVKMIGFDRLDAYVESEIMARAKIRGVSVPNAIAFTPISALPAADFCFGLRRDFPDGDTVLAAIGRAVTALRDNGALTKVRAQFAGPA
jgi:polar amino acid transport system substrate-binding protein